MNNIKITSFLNKLLDANFNKIENEIYFSLNKNNLTTPVSLNINDHITASYKMNQNMNEKYINLSIDNNNTSFDEKYKIELLYQSVYGNFKKLVEDHFLDIINTDENKKHYLNFENYKELDDIESFLYDSVYNNFINDNKDNFSYLIINYRFINFLYEINKMNINFYQTINDNSRIITLKDILPRFSNINNANIKILFNDYPGLLFLKNPIFNINKINEYQNYANPFSTSLSFVINDNKYESKQYIRGNEENVNII